MLLDQHCVLLSSHWQTLGNIKENILWKNYVIRLVLKNERSILMLSESTGIFTIVRYTANWKLFIDFKQHILKLKYKQLNIYLGFHSFHRWQVRRNWDQLCGIYLSSYQRANLPDEYSDWHNFCGFFRNTSRMGIFYHGAPRWSIVVYCFH